MIFDRIFETACAARMCRRAILGSGILSLTLIAMLADGCRQNVGSQTTTSVPAKAARSNELVITSIPFEELNDGEDYNASGVVPLADSRFLFCDNHISDALYELDLTPEGRKKGGLIRRPLQGLRGGSIDDLEGMTIAEEGGRQFVFVTSSFCLKKAAEDLQDKPSRVPSNGLLRVTINPDHGLSAENMPGFRDWLIKNVPELAAAATRKPNDEGLNIEGLAWDRNRHALLFGVRTPAPEGKPLVIPVKLNDLAGPWTTSNLEIAPTIRLTLESAEGAQGIRSLEYIDGLGAFLVVVGNSIEHSDAPFALYEWDGQQSGTLRRLPVTFAKRMKPEGVTGGTVGGKPSLVFVDDDGGFQTTPLETLRR